MLSEKKIDKNYEKLVATNSKFQFLTEEFFTLYGEEIKNGMSLKNSYQYKGGALQFALTVTKYAVMINGVLPKSKQFGESEIIKMSIMYSLKSIENYNEGYNEEVSVETSPLRISGFYKEEAIANNLFRFVNSGCSLNADEFAFIANDIKFVKTAYALGNLINNAIELAELEKVLPESETTVG